VDLALVPKPCIDFRTAVVKLAGCEKFPIESRDAFVEGLRRLEQSWQQVGAMSDAAKQTLADNCNESIDALRGFIATTCELVLPSKSPK